MVRDHYNQSALARELGISRQMLSYIVLDQREITLPLSLKIESLFALPEGKILKIQNEYKIRQYKESLRRELFERLEQAHAFWSYDNVTAIAADVKTANGKIYFLRSFLLAKEIKLLQ